MKSFFMNILNLMYINILWFQIFIIMSFLLNYNFFWFDFNVYLSNLFSLSKFSYMLIFLSLWLMLIIFLMMNFIKENFYIKVISMILCLIVILCFLMNNMLLFFFFFELSLIPTFFIIKLWGFYPERVMASYYLLFYTLFFSFPLLVMIIFLNSFIFSLDFIYYLNFKLLLKLNFFEFFFLIMAFLVKLPIFLFHSWLSKAHVEAPVYGSMLLAGILLKLGGYGLMMFFLFLNYFDNNFILSISILGCLYIGLLNLRNIDLKILIAYSSVIHMGMFMCGLMTYSSIGWIGSNMMMFAHGLISSGLFFMANEFYQCSNSRLFNFNKGLLIYFPIMHLMWFLLCSSNMGVPISLNLICESFILSSIIMYNFNLIYLMIIVIMLSSFYCLYMYIYISHGNMNNKNMLIFNIKNFIIIIMHWLPCNLLFLKLDFYY